MAKVERRSQREIHRLTGIHRDTIRRALAADEPPSYGPRPKRPSKLGPFVGEIERLLDQEPTLSGVRIREEIEELGYCGGKTILDDLLRELRPRYLPPPRTHQRTVYRPGELAQFDLTEPRREIPVGWDQLRKGYLVTCKLPYSRAFAGALVFSKEFPDIAWGMSRCLERLGALPAKLVWDREGAIAPRGQPTEPFLAFCGQLALGWIVLDAGDCQAKGALERDHRFVHGNFEAGRCFANPADFQDQLDRWCDRINERKHRSTRAIVCERLASPQSTSECGPCPRRCPQPTGAGSCGSRPSPTCASTATTTRSIRAWSAGGSRSAPPKPRSSPSPSTAASSPLATAGSSPAGSPSPIPPTRPRSRSCAVSASDAGETPRSRSGPRPATTP